MKIRVFLFLALTVGLAIISAPVMAHHGSSVYDTKLTTYKGTVTDFQFMNPHTEIWFDVTGADGKIEKWTGEAPSLTTMSRLGWNKNLVQTRRPDHVYRQRGEKRHENHAPAQGCVSERQRNRDGSRRGLRGIDAAGELQKCAFAYWG